MQSVNVPPVFVLLAEVTAHSPLIRNTFRLVVTCNFANGRKFAGPVLEAPIAVIYTSDGDAVPPLPEAPHGWSPEVLPPFAFACTMAKRLSSLKGKY